MISFETFETLIDLLQKSYEECHNFNKALESVFGEDSCVWYYKQYDIVAEHIKTILEQNGESEDGADWFVYEGLEQIKKGGTSIGVNGKIYEIKNLNDYYNYLVASVDEKPNLNQIKCWKCGKPLTTENMSNIVYASYPSKYTCKDCE